ncbi:MAG: hypothetical protein Q9228_002322 [Teloschistes exilis]
MSRYKLGKDEDSSSFQFAGQTHRPADIQNLLAVTDASPPVFEPVRMESMVSLSSLGRL